MMELSEKDLAKAKETFENVCALLDGDEWKYQKDEEKFMIRFSARGEDIPMDFIVYIDPHPGLVQLVSVLPFRVSKERMVDAAIASCAINNRLKNGTFDFDISEGMIKFRVSQAYFDSAIGQEVFRYMLIVSGRTVDDYNDKFLMLSKGNLELKDFLEQINQ